MVQQATTRPLLSHDTARESVIRHVVRAAGSRVMIQRFVSWLRGATLGHDTMALRYDTTQQRATTRRRSCDMARSDTPGGAATRRAARPATQLARLATRPGSATILPRRGPRHDAQRALCVRPGRSAHAVGAQPGFRMCTW